MGRGTPSLNAPADAGFRLARGGGSVTVNADGTISLVGDTDITGDLGVTGLSTLTGGATTASFYEVTAGSASAAGRLFGSAAGGMNLRGLTGSQNDFSVLTPAGASLIDNPTGTDNLTFAGDATVAGGTFTIGSRVLLVRGADDILAHRRSTNPQTIRIYGTFTDAANFERLEIVTQAADRTLIQTAAAGTGTVRELAIGPTVAFTGGLINGALSNIKAVDTELTALSGASVTASNLIPAGSFIIGITVRVTTTITGATTFDIGDGIDVDRWGAAIALPAGTTTDITDFTAAGFGQFAAANDVVLTANGANFTAGAVRVTVHYLDLTPATS